MRILFNSRKYDGIAGGVERMSISLMNAMVARGHQVEVMSLDPGNATTFYPLDPAVRWTRIDVGDPGRKARPSEMLERLWAMRAVVRRFRPDVGIGFQQGAFVALAAAALGTRTPVIAAERNAPQRFEHLKDGHGREFQFASFRQARFVTVQFDSYRDHYPEHVRGRIVCIPNPVPPAEGAAAPAGRDGSRKTLLCVARLSYQKNQALLINAFASVAARFPDWDLELVGDGEDRDVVASLAASGALGRIRLAGAQTDVGRHYRAAHLFCLPSRWEGFPNALAEAMAFGLPAVGLAGCAGVNSLIEEGRTGLLARDAGAAALAEALSVLMVDPDRRVVMGAAARKAIASYAPEAVFDQWEALFEQAARR
ncbi:glycosyltransferase [Brevundimonas sp.]|uniref:glycosyltransferase n=1 Tax=Brevundimonas sp. TaxID=1871086 RepID=UPI00286A9A32|nr:glycosyltransferase [Brevundimonas sp.]